MKNQIDNRLLTRFDWLKNSKPWPQSKQCKICLRPFGKNLKKVRDHDHETGKIRDWICIACNTALGFIRDDPDLALRLNEYLVYHKENPSHVIWKKYKAIRIFGRDAPLALQAQDDENKL